MKSVARRKEDNQLGSLLSSTGHGAGAGLAILAHIYPQSHAQSNNNNTNIVLKSGLRSLTTTPIITKSSSFTSSSSSSTTCSSSVISSAMDSNDGDYYYNSRLKSCSLCFKPLRPDQDIYMYRGDQGFCSEECRNRQIMLDERKEKEAELANKKKMMATATTLSFIDCRDCETCRLLEDLRRQGRQRRRRHKLVSTTKHQPILSLS